MQLGILLAIVATILASEHAPAEPVVAVSSRLIATVAGSSFAVLFAFWSSRLISRSIRADSARRGTWLLWFERLQRVHLILWLVTIAVAIHVLDWPQVVRYNWGLDNAPLLRDLVILGPVWIPLLFSWAAFYDVEQAARSGSSHFLSHGSSRSDEAAGRGQYVWLRTRHYLGLCFVPILALLTFQDCVTLLQPNWQQSDFGWLLYLLPIAGITLALPQLLSRIWPTTPMSDSPLRTKLRRLTERVGVRARDFRIWKTNRQMLNAAVTGLIPSLRYVFLTDGLLAVLRDDEAESVIAHELGHIQRRHLWLRMLLLGLPIWIMGNLEAFAPELSDCWCGWFVNLTGSELVVSSLFIPAITVLYAVMALGRYSRMLEHDADLCVHDNGQTEVFCATIDRLSYLSNHHRQRHTWLHPSTASRIHLLQRALHDPQAVDHFRRRVNRFNGVLVAAWILTPLILILA